MNASSARRCTRLPLASRDLTPVGRQQVLAGKIVIELPREWEECWLGCRWQRGPLSFLLLLGLVNF